MEEKCSLKNIKIFRYDLESLISDLQDPAYTQRLICKEDNRNYFATNSIHDYVNMKLMVSNFFTSQSFSPTPLGQSLSAILIIR